LVVGDPSGAAVEEPDSVAAGPDVDVSSLEVSAPPPHPASNAKVPTSTRKAPNRINMVASFLYSRPCVRILLAERNFQKPGLLAEKPGFFGSVCDKYDGVLCFAIRLELLTEHPFRFSRFPGRETPLNGEPARGV